MQGDKYRVITKFCDDYEMEHEHAVLIVATKEWADQAADAIEPSHEHPEARHIVQVLMEKLNDKGKWILVATTPIFECEHNTGS